MLEELVRILNLDENPAALMLCAVVALLAAIAALLTALYTKRNAEKRILVQSTTGNRMEWIKDVRRLLTGFCETFRSAPENKELLCRLRTYLLLYMREDRADCKPLLEAMRLCCMGFIPKECHMLMYDRLILASQYTLAAVWVRAKTEGAQGETNENKISRIVSGRLEGLREALNTNAMVYNGIIRSVVGAAEVTVLPPPGRRPNGK